jgi:hypothetical protein
MRELAHVLREDETEVFPELTLEREEKYSPLFRDASIHHVFPSAYVPIGKILIVPLDGQLPSFTIFSDVMYEESQHRSWNKINLMNLGNNTYIIRFELQ